jgi:hypothetical protein
MRNSSLPASMVARDGVQHSIAVRISVSIAYFNLNGIAAAAD